MTWSSQLGNFWVGLLGGASTWVAVVVAALCLFWTIRFVYQHWPDRHVMPVKLASGVVWRLLISVFFFYLFIIVSSNAPKHTLTPDFSDEMEAKQALQEKPLEQAKNLAPDRRSAEESTERLQEMREQQKSDSSIDN